jgi:hypothetical protein
VGRAGPEDKVREAAWRMSPSWFAVTGQDHKIDPALHATMAAQIHANVVRVNTSHLVMLSKPWQVDTPPRA